MNAEPTSAAKVLIVDDEEGVRNLLADLLRDSYECLTAESADRGLELIRDHHLSVVVTDINMPGTSGIDLIPLVRQHSPDTVVMVISGNRTIDNAIDALREGAFDFIRKPFELDQVELAVRRAVQHHDLLRAKRLYEQRLEEMVQARTEQLEYLAYYDELTGLPNRTMLAASLTRAMVNCTDDACVAALVIAPDRFRDIRNTLGQESADRLLKELADRLRSISVPDVILSRSDTDEFTAVLPRVRDKGEIDVFADRIFDSLRSPLTAGGRKIFLTASVGISVTPRDGEDSHTIIRNAGAALTHARRHGSRREYFDRSMQEAAMRRLLVENDLRHALARGELAVHFQPKIANFTGQIKGFEALVRWHHPGGEVTPSEFVPVAEASGSILELGEWVLNEACREAGRWHRDGHDMTIAVNVSAAQFDADLVDVVEKAISHSRLDPKRLELEVTESSLMTSASHSAELIRELKKTGLKIAIDDFGTGYSSLGQLRRLPIDVLKIDRSFIADVTRNSDDASLIMGIISLAHNLNLKVVAEGVETAEQLRFLNLLKCDEWQGFLASGAVDSDAARRMLQENTLFCA